MGKVIGGLIVVLGLWAGIEIATKGPSRAFDGALAGIVDVTPEQEVDDRSTARRTGDVVEQAHREAQARRERMLQD